MAIQDKTLKLEKVEYPQAVVSGVIFLMVFILLFSKMPTLLWHSNSTAQFFSAIICVLTLYTVPRAIWKIIGQTLLSVSNGVFYIKYKLLFLSVTKKYETTNISNLNLGKTADSVASWSFLGRSFYWKISALSFNYKPNKKIEIKGNLSDEDFNLLKQWIEG